MNDSLLIAVGGNSLIRAGQQGTIPEQFVNARLVCERIADLASQGYKILVTHGNGPQVGSQLLRSEAGSSQTYTLPLDVCVAMTQGEIGYILQTTLQSVLRERDLHIPVLTIITHVMVDKHDRAFSHPTKPIGPFYSEEIAHQKKKELHWAITEDAARGYRRVVPSPKPCAIAEVDIIRLCLSHGMIVIACGGGGIPVITESGTVQGIEAVIDKDRASALLATQLGIKRFIISTDTEHVCLNFKKSGQTPIRTMDVLLAKKLLNDGHFLEGSMKPKIEASIEFLEAGGEEVIIIDPAHIVSALNEQSGTHIIREERHEIAAHY